PLKQHVISLTRCVCVCVCVCVFVCFLNLCVCVVSSSLSDVGGFFEAGTLVRYDFLSESAATNQDTRFVAQPSTTQEVNLTGEAVAFSFSTSNTPAILLYVSSKTQDYLALVLRQNGTLQVRYNLGGLKEPFTIDVDQRNLANGQPHTINMSRSNRTITIQLDHYPPVSYSLPEASDTQFNLVKTLFLGKVFGEYRHLKCVFDRSAWQKSADLL
ncbi:unnamed protein product, partial [Oncorhynchus mykiss]